MSPAEFRFDVQFYEDDEGAEPVVAFLAALSRSNAQLAARVGAALLRLEDSRYHRSPLVEHLGDDLFEVRVSGKNSTRVLFFHGGERRVILVHAFLKKTQKTPKRDLAVALARKQRFEERQLEDTS